MLAPCDQKILSESVDAVYNVYCLFWQVKIWDDRRTVPLSVMKPHDGKAVYSVSFLTAPEQPNHINLVTAVCILLRFHILTIFAVIFNHPQQHVIL